jgi:hypothetical protein
MPLPKPLPKSASKAKKKAVMAETMHDLKSGAHHNERTHAQEVAIGLKQSGANERLGLPPAKGQKAARKRQAKAAKRMPRNSGRK